MRRVLGWLANQEHGDLLSVVLTQRVLEGETLKAARDRLSRKQRKYMLRLQRSGMVAALTTQHIVFSAQWRGWHVHAHCLVEFPAGTATTDWLLDQWLWAAGQVGEEVCVQRGEKEQARLVLGAGAAIASLREDSGESDFWDESKDAAARAVQYPVRDIAQGVSMWRLGGSVEGVEHCATEIIEAARGWKLHRAWGRWQRPCPVQVATEAKEEVGERPKVATPPERCLGTVLRCWREARGGDAAMQAVFRSLERTVSNKSEFARRFVRFCRAAWDPGLTHARAGP